MVLSAPRSAVLTGAPGAGKTTLLKAAGEAGFGVSHEVARTLLQAPGGMELRRDDPLGFAHAMTEAHLREYAEMSDAAGAVIFDRGLPDVVGFLDVTGLVVSAEIDAACREVRYSGPIFRLPAWRAIYRQDAERIQDWDAAVASDAAVTAAWQRYGYEVHIMPEASLAVRLGVLTRALSE